MSHRPGQLWGINFEKFIFYKKINLCVTTNPTRTHIKEIKVEPLVGPHLLFIEFYIIFPLMIYYPFCVYDYLAQNSSIINCLSSVIALGSPTTISLTCLFTLGDLYFPCEGFNSWNLYSVRFLQQSFSAGPGIPWPFCACVECINDDHSISMEWCPFWITDVLLSFENLFRAFGLFLAQSMARF